ncbi:MAG TPA: thioesterase family protein [Candidatus Omnitrophota bacterium]|jgi:1,4-dihydroxy-2-naphthoyl-CoA hydrolase|nr:thioesterase family protein [Candidatus Omnitrophota bacterium]
MSVRASLPVRFQDVDAAGVLFFGRIYDYCHQAYEELWAAAGVDRAWIFSGADFLIPIAHSEADYRAPLRHGERVDVRVDVTHVGRASFHLAYRVTGPRGDGDLRATAKTVHAFVARETMRPIPIPEELRVFLLRHLVQEPVAHHPPK